VFLEPRERLRAHAALADDGADAVALDDLGLVRLFADAGRRPAAVTRQPLPPSFTSSFTTTGPQ